MPELDFSKIFGETATSKASFTDVNYLNGWGYLGSTPPPYQLFDYLQSLNDKKTKYLYDKTIENDNKLALHNTNATAHADIRAKITSDINSHNSNTSAHTEILNAIKAISGMSAYDTAPSKTIASMIPLLGFGGIVAQKLGDNGYVKFANGLTIQWGNSKSPIAYPITFSEKPINFLFHKTGANKKVIVISGADSPTLQYFDLWDATDNYLYTNNPTVNYVAFGKS